MNVLLKTDTFLSGAKMEDVLGIKFTVGQTEYRVGNFVDTKAQNAIALVKRENGKVQITVDADLEAGLDTTKAQAQFESYAKGYNFPKGISYNQ